MQKKLNNEKGMTLIELLAVIVIIAIIAAIAIPAIGNIIENSRVGAAKSDILNAQSAAVLFLADNPGDTEVTLADLLGKAGTGGATSGSSYLDDQASLTSFEYYPSSKKVYAVAVDGKIQITTGTDGTGVTKADIADLPSNTDGTVGEITVERDYAVTP